MKSYVHMHHQRIFMQNRIRRDSYSHKQVISIPGFYKSRPTKNQTSADKATVGNKINRGGKEQVEVQVEGRRAPPPSRVGNGECHHGCVHDVELKSNDYPPPNARSNEINLNEIEAALKEFDSLENPTIIGKATCPELRPHAASEEVHATMKMGINSAAFISAITPDLNSNEVLRPHASSEDIHAKPNSKGINSINSSAFISDTNSVLKSEEVSSKARDNQNNPRVLVQATKPRWTRVVRANNKPSQEGSLGKQSKGKRTVALNDDHSKLPNKHYQVSRNEEDAGIILAEADTQPR
nr:hypothetical protein CFP56_58842 [Quercus suber]